MNIFNMEHVIGTINGHGVLTRCVTMFHSMGWQNAMPVNIHVSAHLLTAMVLTANKKASDA
jgi:hypothetical protein